MEILLAEHAGFCFGVKRAIERALEETHKRGHLYSHGPLIHNHQVVEALRQKGLEPVDDLEDVPRGETVLLRAHGAGPQVYEKAAQRELEIIDTTCPFVARAQKQAARLHEAGYSVLVLGDHQHPEAHGIRAHTGGRAHIVAGPGEVDIQSLPDKVALVCQTTQKIDGLRDVVNALLPSVSELVVANTICDATTRRQEASRQMAEHADVVIVIGGRHSANTTRLAQICGETGKPTYHIETADEIDCSWFAGAAVVGITAGASTPHEAIEAANDRIRQCEGELQ